MKKIHQKLNCAYSWIVYIYLDTPGYYWQFDTKYVHVTQEKKLKNEIIKFGKNDPSKKKKKESTVLGFELRTFCLVIQRLGPLSHSTLL